MAKKVYEGFEINWPGGYKPGDWIGVFDSWPDRIEHRFEIRLRYSKRGELLCAGLRIEESESNLYRWVWPVDERNITRRMLVGLPLGDVLRYIQNERVHDPAVRERLERLGLRVGLPPGGLWVRPGPKGLPDEAYIEAAELFKAEHVPGSNAEVYRRLADQRYQEESVFRRHVRRGWELRPDLQPTDIRTRHTTKEDQP